MSITVLEKAFYNEKHG